MLGGTRRLVNPVGTEAVSLSGINPTQIGIPPAPALASAERAGEAVEVYWQALLRNVPLTELHDGTENRDVLAAAEELSKLSHFRGPKAGGRVTPGTLFRSSALYFDSADPRGLSVTPPGVLDGPLISQFLLRDAPYSSQWIGARISTASPASEFLTDYEEWLGVYRTARRRAARCSSTRRRANRDGRDLAEYVRNPPAFAWAASLLRGTPAGGPDPRYSGLYPAAQPASYPSNPYRRSKNQAPGAASFGLPYVQALLAEGTSYAVRASYWQKYFVHRTVRPEAYGGLAHHRLANGVSDYPLHDDFLRSEALKRSKAKYGTYLLSQTYPGVRRCTPPIPAAPRSPGRHGPCSKRSSTRAGSFRSADSPIRSIRPARALYGSPAHGRRRAEQARGEQRLGRNWSGIHGAPTPLPRVAAGEAVAISILRNERRTFHEPFDGFTFTKFDGSPDHRLTRSRASAPTAGRSARS